MDIHIERLTPKSKPNGWIVFLTGYTAASAILVFAALGFRGELGDTAYYISVCIMSTIVLGCFALIGSSKARNYPHGPVVWLSHRLKYLAHKPYAEELREISAEILRIIENTSAADIEQLMKTHPTLNTHRNQAILWKWKGGRIQEWMDKDPATNVVQMADLMKAIYTLGLEQPRAATQSSRRPLVGVDTIKS